MAGDAWPRTTRLLPWSLAAFLAMLFLIPFDAASLPVDRPFLVAIAGLWLLALAAVRGNGRPRLRGSVLHGAIAFFVITAIVSVLTNSDTLRLHGELGLGLKKVMLLLSFVALFAIVASTIRPGEARSFIPLIVALGCVAAGLEVPSIATEDDSAGRIPVLGPTTHPLALTQLLVMIVPFAVVGGLYANTRRRRVLYVLATLILLAGLFSTQRKTGPIVLAAGLGTLFLFRPRRLLRAAPAGALLVLAIPLIAPSAIGSVRDQLAPDRAVGAVSSRDRLSDYDAIGPEVLNHPAVGRGWQTYEPERYRVLDNEYLAILIGNGWVGIGAFVLMLIAALIVCARAVRTDDPERAPPALAVAAVVVTVAVASATFDTIAFVVVPYAFFFLLGLGVACTPEDQRGRLRSWISKQATRQEVYA
jgi:O-antigen ligase/polysaccharide polymerase Wzy-like membrane protein